MGVVCCSGTAGGVQVAVLRLAKGIEAVSALVGPFAKEGTAVADLELQAAASKANRANRSIAWLILPPVGGSGDCGGARYGISTFLSYEGGTRSSTAVKTSLTSTMVPFWMEVRRL
jgi:hypothetical protein